MLSTGKGRAAPVYGHALGHATYERHRPEQTLLYRLIEKHYPALVEQLEVQGKSLPTHVHGEFEAYLKCGRLEHGFLRVRCDKCHFERLVAFSCKKRGFCPAVAPIAWPRQRLFSLMKYFPTCHCVSGSSVFLSLYDTCSLPIPRQWVRCWASYTGRFPLT